MSSDYQLEDTVFIPFTTRAFATGIPTVLAGTPAIDIYEDAGTTQVITGETLAVSLDSVVGFNMITVTATAATGFEAGKSYTAIIQAGTVDSVSVVGEVVGHFTLDMSAAAKDLANATDGLGAIKTETALIVEDTAELQGDDIPTLIADVPTVAEFNARTLVAAAYFDPTADAVGTVTTVTNQLSAATVANQVWDTDATGRQTAGTFGQAIGDPASNTETMYDAVVTDATGTNVAADVVAVKSETVLIVADTAELQTDNVPGLIAALNDLAGADVLTEVNTALDTAISELGVAAPTATPTVRTALMLMYMALRNKLVVQTSGTDALELYNNAGTKIAAKLISDDGADYTEAEMA